MLKTERKLHRSDLTICYFYIVWHSWLVFIKDTFEKLRIFISRTTLIIFAPLACTHKPKQTNKTTTKPNKHQCLYSGPEQRKHSSMMFTTDLLHANGNLQHNQIFFFLPEKQNLVHVVFMWQSEVDVGICSSTAFLPYFLRWCLALNLMALLSRLVGQ